MRFKNILRFTVKAGVVTVAAILVASALLGEDPDFSKRG
jgi:hypothetical protein